MKKAARFLPLVLAGGVAAQAGSFDWPPGGAIQTADGRNAEIFWHGTRAEWGKAPHNQTDYFLVLHPKKERENAPLYVVLHSAGHNAMTAIRCVGRTGDHDLYHPPKDFYALYVDCKNNIWQDWWWGGLHVNDKSLDKNKGGALRPVENRVIDTVRWVVERYKIDPNRVYLAGISMGGSGALGIGMRHGDVFAAVKVGVPAGIEHVSNRMYFMEEAKPEGLAIPDPPPVVDYSAPNDNWSFGHERFVESMRKNRYALTLYWGAFGHGSNFRAIAQKNDLIESFDWLEIRRNEAYPVFTAASSDDAIPWPENLKETKPGQINGFFRWKNVHDRADSFAMELRLLKEGEWKTVFVLPQEATADVTLRRLQAFHVAPNQRCAWTFGTARGEAVADATGLLTLPKLKITREPAVLEIKKLL